MSPLRKVNLTERVRIDERTVKVLLSGEMNGAQSDDGPLSVSEIRQILSHYRREGKGNVKNLLHAARSAHDLCERVTRSPVYQSMRTRPSSKEVFESDVAWLITSYRWLLERVKRIGFSERDESTKRLYRNLDANLKNLLKTLQKGAPHLVNRLSEIVPSTPAQASRCEGYVDEDLRRIGKRINEGTCAAELLSLVDELLKKRTVLVRQVRENPALRESLPEETLMQSLANTLDSLQQIARGFSSTRTTPELEPHLATTKNMAQLFESFLNKHGVYRMEVKDSHVDPDLVEVVETQFTARSQRHHVTKIVSEGFFYLGKPIKVARVGVAVRPDLQ